MEYEIDLIGRSEINNWSHVKMLCFGESGTIVIVSSGGTITGEPNVLKTRLLIDAISDT